MKQFLINLTIDLGLTLTIGAIVFCLMHIYQVTPEDIFGWVIDHAPTLTTERPKYL